MATGATPNLRLPLFEGADIVDYMEFNSAFTAIDRLATDYVIEQMQTTSNTGVRWYYRKWNSGRMEQWIDSSGELFTRLTCYVWNRSEFVNTQRLTFGDYPIKFSQRPFVTIVFNYCTSPNDCLGFVAHKASSGGVTSPSFCLVTANENSNLTTILGAVFGLYASGWWR